MGWLVLALLLWPQPPQQPTPAAPVPDAASLERIADGLQRPPLTIPPLTFDTPVFRAEVTERPLTALEAALKELAENPGGPAGVIRLGGARGGGTDILPAIAGLYRKVQRARYQREEQRVREEVTAELAEFCRVHQCSTSEREQIEGVVLPP